MQDSFGDPGGIVAHPLSARRRPLAKCRRLGLGIPPAGDYDLVLEVAPHKAGQRWVNRFANHVLTTQYDRRGLLIARAGLASLGFELLVEGESLLFRARRAWLFGIPLPLWLSPRIEAENHPAGSDAGRCGSASEFRSWAKWRVMKAR